MSLVFYSRFQKTETSSVWAATKKKKKSFLADEASQAQCGGWQAELLAGDHTAFAEFVDKYKEMVFLCCRTLGLTEAEAEDAAGETFLAAFKSLKKYKGKSELSTWLWRIAYFKSVDYLRRNNRISRLSGEIEAEIADNREQTPTAAAENSEQTEKIWAAVDKLPRLWAVVVILYYRQEKSVRDIAKIMRIRENTAKTYLFRARKALKLILAPMAGENIDAD